jgi:para-nitrobenzyl esterase
MEACMDPVIQTQSGAVRGTISGEGIWSFKGIPYAAAPFGANRFKAPQPVEPWTGVREALTFGPTSLQAPYPPPFDRMLANPIIPGDECLNLNVWTPEPGATGLPVMVWIHGGSFIRGSNAVPTYDGSAFARDGVVCVGINYRLGVDGFLFLGDGISNLGILDQIAALRWVQENIAAFGGDPGNVTVFAESAGAFSVGALIAMPRANGLFRRAILESGAGHHVLSAATARRVGEYLAEKLGVPPTREAIAAVPLDRLIEAQVQLGADAAANPDTHKWGEIVGNLMVFEPVIDGETLTDLPIRRMFSGSGANIDVLVGTTAEEWRFFMVPPGVIDMINDATLNRVVAAYGLPVEQTLATYRRDRPGASDGDLMAAVITDWFFRIPAIRMAEAHITSAGAGSTYLYEFAWRSPLFDGRLGACHAVELPFVFDVLADSSSDGLVGSEAPQSLADAVHRAWVSFATRGDPGWAHYDLNRRVTMRFTDGASAAADDPREAERVLWDGRR